MDGAQDDISTTIFDITHACVESFDRVVAEYDESFLTQPFAPDDATATTSSRRRSTYGFLGLRDRFWLFWIDYNGALSLMSSSPDARSQGLTDMSDMVMELLEMILRNLHRSEFVVVSLCAG